MKYTLTIYTPSGETIYRNTNLTRKQAENLIGLNTLKLKQ